jgi:hypothetical protein
MQPTRYVVLLDENGYKSDELQKMTKCVAAVPRSSVYPCLAS